MYIKILKPLSDWILALLSLMILLPFFIIIALAIKIDNPGPVFFMQKRLGQKGKIFTLIKFRSMVYGIENMVPTKLLYENDPRITRVGRFIRKTSIDELPQIINVLKGEMSFIGPRPPMVHFPKRYDQYNEFELNRFKVKPGISGLAQIKCREIHDWDINIPIDVEYVRDFSFMNDLNLFLSSLSAFFRTDNVYRKDEQVLD